MKHTKGPWKIIPNAENEFSLVIPSKYADAYGLDVEVGSIRHKHHAEMIVSAVNETNQNRRKFEAAEEMARALKEITDFYMNGCQCTLSNGFVCVVHRTKKALSAWEKAGKGNL